MVSLEEAQNLILNSIGPLNPEKVELLQGFNRVLAEDVCSPMSIPPFDRSPLDGYAVRGEDTRAATLTAPASLEIVEVIPAGYGPQMKILAGTAARIFTGAPIPQGANAVIRQEDVRSAANRVIIDSPIAPGSNISRAGEDISRGDLILRKGELLTPPGIGVLSAVGITQVRVFRRPRIGIISTGDELVSPPEPLTPGKIYNSNLFTMSGLVTQSGGIPVNYPAVADRLQEMTKAIAFAVETNNLVITTGGVSVGDYDIVNQALEALGGQLLFWRLNMKPGTPALAAIVQDKLFIGLSGNPAAATITYYLLAHPAIQKMIGLNSPGLTRVLARSVDGFHKTSSQRRFLRARLDFTHTGPQVTLTGKQNPGVLRSMIGSNALIDLQPHQALAKGDMVETLMLPAL